MSFVSKKRKVTSGYKERVAESKKEVKDAVVHPQKGKKVVKK